MIGGRTLCFDAIFSSQEVANIVAIGALMLLHPKVSLDRIICGHYILYFPRWTDVPAFWPSSHLLEPWCLYPLLCLQMYKASYWSSTKLCSLDSTTSLMSTSSKSGQLRYKYHTTFKRRYKMKRRTFICAGSQLWFQHDGKCEQGRICDRSSNCRPWWTGPCKLTMFISKQMMADFISLCIYHFFCFWQNTKLTD